VAVHREFSPEIGGHGRSCRESSNRNALLPSSHGPSAGTGVMRLTPAVVCPPAVTGRPSEASMSTCTRAPPIRTA
jgi:hypothetical protein